MQGEKKQYYEGFLFVRFLSKDQPHTDTHTDPYAHTQKHILTHQ